MSLDSLLDAYVANIAAGLEKVRVWAKDQPDLTDDVWKLPNDCPLWHMGLSLAQADAILQQIHREKKGEQ